jgi:hypothetical protein
MKAWQPVPTIKSTIILFIALTIFFLIFGIVLIVYSNDVKEYTVQYNEDCNLLPNCTITINVTQKMESPVFVYYELDNYYQNHRRYVKSRNVDQLQGDTMSYDDIKTDCDPVVRNKDIRANLMNIYNELLPPEGVANPCGLIAKSLFTDTYTIALSSNLSTPIEISSLGIAWPADKENKYKRCKDDCSHT